MIMQTNELIGRPLDWAVTQCEGGIWQYYYADETYGELHYSTDDREGGAIIDKYEIATRPLIWDDDPTKTIWAAGAGKYELDDQHFVGPTRLVAAMRCRVALKYGASIDVPDEVM